MRRGGFTLIELLVVIAIIAILAALLFPVFVHVRHRTSTVRCLDNQKQLTAAFRSYMTDYNGRMPRLDPWDSVDDTPPPANWCGAVYPVCCWIERGSLYPYVRTRSPYLCPCDIGVKAEHINLNPKNYPLSYSVNYCLEMTIPDSLVRRPSIVLFMLHEGRDTINDGLLVWDAANDDMPSSIHYNGTTACFVDGHARYLTYNELKKRRKTGEWDPKPRR